LTGLRVVRAYNAENFQEERFNTVNTELTNTHLFTSRVMSFMQPSIQLVMSGLTVAIYWIGAILINNAGFDMKLTLLDRKSTRLNSSHVSISYAVYCLKKKKLIRDV